MRPEASLWLCLIRNPAKPSLDNRRAPLLPLRLIGQLKTSRIVEMPRRIQAFEGPEIRFIEMLVDKRHGPLQQTTTYASAAQSIVDDKLS
jgi:hypothetical protein